MSWLCAGCQGNACLRVVGVLEHAGGRWKPGLRLGGGHELNAWMLAPVHPVDSLDTHDHDLERMPVTARASEAVGWFEIVVCRTCGLTRWFAREAETLHDSTEVVNELCDDCGIDGPKTWVEPAQRGCGTVAAPGTLGPGLLASETKDNVSLAICRSCSGARWVLRDLEVAKPGYWNDFKNDEGPACRRCRDSRGSVLKPVPEDICVVARYRSMPFPVTMKKGSITDTSTEGRFRVRVCCGCGDITWHAEKIEGIEPDPERGIFFDSADAAKPSTSSGPYR